MMHLQLGDWHYCSDDSTVADAARDRNELGFVTMFPKRPAMWLAGWVYEDAHGFGYSSDQDWHHIADEFSAAVMLLEEASGECWTCNGIIH